MSLRWKLLLASLSLLVLPWSGWRLLQLMEAQLREGQTEVLAATAETVARSLLGIRGALPPDGPRWVVQKLPRTPRLDGQLEDWRGVEISRASDDGGMTRVEAALGSVLDDLYLHMKVADATVQRADAHWPTAAQADHVLLELDGTHGKVSLRLANAGSGDLKVSAADGQPASLRLVGHWHEVAGEGYVIEALLPRGWPLRSLGMRVHDAAPSASSWIEFTGAAEGDARWPVWQPQARVADRLRSLLPEGVRGRLVDLDGWVYADEGELAPADADARLPWWKRQLWLALAFSDASYVEEGAAQQRTRHPLVWQALSGVGGATWQRDTAAPRLLLSVVTPLGDSPSTRAALWLQSEQQTLLRADRALGGLLGTTLAALAVVLGVLLAFASRLSLRIRRLRDAVDGALGGDGQVQAFAPTRDGDEIGDLSRSFSRLLSEVGASQAYLRSLAGKLSHELNTPLAVVRGALDNIDAAELAADDRASLERARAGGDRLAHIVRAMSEASRIEQALAQVDTEDFDLAALLRQCAEGYRQLLAPRKLELALGHAAFPLHGSAELIVQAVDKLIDNARSFTPPEGWVRIELQRAVDGIDLVVSNSGPPLPSGIRHRLFESLVSERSGRQADGVHLGFGLHVVRLIVGLHGGQCSAQDLPAGDGVAFVLRLRGMPRGARHSR